jgi:hypothetical protein
VSMVRVPMPTMTLSAVTVSSMPVPPVAMTMSSNGGRWDGRSDRKHQSSDHSGNQGAFSYHLKTSNRLLGLLVPSPIWGLLCLMGWTLFTPP